MKFFCNLGSSKTCRVLVKPQHLFMNPFKLRMFKENLSKAEAVTFRMGVPFDPPNVKQDLQVKTPCLEGIGRIGLFIVSGRWRLQAPCLCKCNKQSFYELVYKMLTNNYKCKLETFYFSSAI